MKVKVTAAIDFIVLLSCDVISGKVLIFGYCCNYCLFVCHDFALLLCLYPEKESGIFYGTTSLFPG